MLSLNKRLLLSLVFSSGVLGLTFAEEMKLLAVRLREGNDSGTSDSSCIRKTCELYRKPKVCNVGRIIESKICEYQRDILDERRIECNKAVKPFCVNEYIEKTCLVIPKIFGVISAKSKDELCRSLTMIFGSFKVPSREMLAVFTTHALFNTSCFKELEDKTGEEYRCRGLLMIKGKENYCKLDEQIFIDISFAKEPSRLAKLDKCAIQATVNFFLTIASKCYRGSLYRYSLESLKPMEYVRAQEHRQTEEDIKKLKKRTALYNHLIAEYSK